ncbi:MAG: hypothetical protein ACRDYC_14130, partial [Acidimicrobiales bacterium]
ASGILIFNAGPETVQNNHVSGNDVNIYAGEDTAFSPAYATPGQWSITGNTISDAVNNQANGYNTPNNAVGDGIQLDSTANDVDVNGNTIDGAANYGIESGCTGCPTPPSTTTR